MNEASAHDEILALMRAKEARPVHVEHVTRLALSLFDQLAELHGFGEPERLLLEAAGCLHDIGHQFDHLGGGHHLESARMIREHPWKHFSRPEIEVIAQVARYHRKSMPEMADEEFKALPDWDRRIVQRLAALLRLGDALDKNHLQLVQSVTVEIRPNQLVFHLEVTGPVLREIRLAYVKGDLAQAVFQRDLRFMVGEEEILPA